MRLSFTGFPESNPDVAVTFIWEDGVFTAHDPISEDYLPRFLEFAKDQESVWAIAPGLPSEPPGDHTKTPVGIWFLLRNYMQYILPEGGESDPNGVPTPPGWVE